MYCLQYCISPLLSNNYVVWMDTFVTWPTLVFFDELSDSSFLLSLLKKWIKALFLVYQHSNPAQLHTLMLRITDAERKNHLPSINMQLPGLRGFRFVFITCSLSFIRATTSGAFTPFVSIFTSWPSGSFPTPISPTIWRTGRTRWTGVSASSMCFILSSTQSLTTIFTSWTTSITWATSFPRLKKELCLKYPPALKMCKWLTEKWRAEISQSFLSSNTIYG